MNQSTLRLLFWAILIGGLSVAQSCGKKTNPVPIDAEYLNLRPIEDGRAYYKGNEFRIRWSRPNVDKPDRWQKTILNRVVKERTCLDCEAKVEIVAEITNGGALFKPPFAGFFVEEGPFGILEFQSFPESPLERFYLNYQTELGYSPPGRKFSTAFRFRLPKPVLNWKIFEMKDGIQHVYIQFAENAWPEGYFPHKLFVLVKAGSDKRLLKKIALSPLATYRIETREKSLFVHLEDPYHNQSESVFIPVRAAETLQSLSP